MDQSVGSAREKMQPEKFEQQINALAQAVFTARPENQEQLVKDREALCEFLLKVQPSSWNKSTFKGRCGEIYVEAVKRFFIKLLKNELDYDVQRPFYPYFKVVVGLNQNKMGVPGLMQQIYREEYLQKAGSAEKDPAKAPPLSLSAPWLGKDGKSPVSLEEMLPDSRQDEYFAQSEPEIEIQCSEEEQKQHLSDTARAGIKMTMEVMNLRQSLERAHGVSTRKTIEWHGVHMAYTEGVVHALHTKEEPERHRYFVQDLKTIENRLIQSLNLNFLDFFMEKKGFRSVEELEQHNTKPLSRILSGGQDESVEEKEKPCRLPLPAVVHKAFFTKEYGIEKVSDKQISTYRTILRESLLKPAKENQRGNR